MWLLWCHQIFTTSDRFLECEFDFFGQNCENKCGKCKGDIRCNVNNGMCLEGCQEHWSPPNCTGKYTLWPFITPCHSPEYPMKMSIMFKTLFNGSPTQVWELHTNKKQLKYTTFLWKRLKIMGHIPIFSEVLTAGFNSKWPKYIHLNKHIYYHFILTYVSVLLFDKEVHTWHKPVLLLTFWKQW